MYTSVYCNGPAKGGDLVSQRDRDDFAEMELLRGVSEQVVYHFVL
jgi:hypothetical protein